jgi:hypothetical protein
MLYEDEEKEILESEPGGFSVIILKTAEVVNHSVAQCWSTRCHSLRHDVAK